MTQNALSLLEKLESVVNELKSLFHLEINKDTAEKLQKESHERLTPELKKELKAQPPVGGCSHLKGIGAYKDEKTEFGEHLILAKDYNVSMHTFPNGKTRIRCNRCGEVRWEGERGFEEFLGYVKQSTNYPSSSEIAPPTGIWRSYRSRSTDAIDKTS